MSQTRITFKIQQKIKSVAIGSVATLKVKCVATMCAAAAATKKKRKIKIFVVYPSLPHAGIDAGHVRPSQWKWPVGLSWSLSGPTGVQNSDFWVVNRKLFWSPRWVLVGTNGHLKAPRALPHALGFLLGILGGGAPPQQPSRKTLGPPPTSLHGRKKRLLIHTGIVRVRAHYSMCAIQ